METNVVVFVMKMNVEENRGRGKPIKEMVEYN
jgi:hypothetical protein